MPPTIKTTEAAILDAAFEMARAQGIAGVNARNLAKTLGCSIQPIFRNFQNMDNLKKRLYQRALTYYNDVMTQETQGNNIPLLGISLAHVEFANREKNLYHFLFLSGAPEDKSLLDMLEEEKSREQVMRIARMTKLSQEKGEQLFTDIWLITRGLASLLATSRIEFSEEQVVTMLTVLVDSFMGIQQELAKRS